MSLLGLGLVPVGTLPAVADDDPTQDIVRSVDIEIELDESGLAHVSETYRWDFGTRNGLGFYRNLVQYMGWEDDRDLRRRYVYTDFEVASPSGAPAEVWVESDYGSEIKLAVGAEDGSSDTRTGVQTYVLEYTVEGTLNEIQDQSGSVDQEQFYWNLFTTSDVLMEEVTVTVSGPDEVIDYACYEGPLGSDDPCLNYSATDDSAQFQAADLPAGDGFTVVAGFPVGTFADTDPILVEKPEDSGGTGFPIRSNPVNDFVTANWVWLTLGWVALLGAWGYRRYRKGRDLHYVGLPANVAPASGTENQYKTAPVTGDTPVTVQFHPPRDMTPAEGAVLLEERANPKHITATIVDLAVRGYLTIKPITPGGILSSEDWRLSRVPNPPSFEELRDYESQLLGNIFKNRELVAVSSLSGSFSSAVTLYTDGLTRVSDANGWFTRKGLVRSAGGLKLVRNVIIAFVALSFLGTARFVLSAVAGANASLFGSAIFVVFSLWLMLWGTAKLAHARSAAGRALYEQVRGFKQYLATAETDQLRLEQDEDIFSKYLPWAMVFGVADRWSRMFEQLADEGRYNVAPVWFVSSEPFSASSFRSMGSSMGSFASTGASSLNYTPGSSGGSGSFGSSGGGFSGGGGGGGGVGGR